MENNRKDPGGCGSPRLKLCGMTSAADIEYVNILRPDYIGFVFAKSKRQVSAEQAQKLRAALSDEIYPVGVFRDSPIEMIAGLYEKRVISVAQLHGSEDSEYISSLKRQCDIPLIKAIKVNASDDIAAADSLMVDYLLLDSGGGTGIPFDWSLIKRPEKPFFIAGGINAGNIKTAMSFYPFGIDVSSGIERDGVKDFGLMKELTCLLRI